MRVSAAEEAEKRAADENEFAKLTLTEDSAF